MAVFRIEKTKNYTVMSNHHLRNAALSLKAKGLLSQMLSLPDNWDYTLKGLSLINRENLDAIRQAVKELEKAGYITRSRVRDEKGKLRGSDYIIHELPQDKPEPPEDDDPMPQPEKPEKPINSTFPPTLDFPTLDNPTQDKPTLENPTQLNKDILSKDLLNTDSIPFPSPTPSQLMTNRKETEGNGKELTGINAIEAYREIVNRNIGYGLLIEQYRYDRQRIDEIADLILETICTSRKTIRIAGDDYPAELVKAKFLKLNSLHIEFVIECMKNNTTEIRNIKKYLLAVLFNAPTTMDSYYTAQVAYDRANRLI